MKLKKKIAAGAAALLLLGSVMNVSAAELYSRDDINALIKNDQVKYIIDVDAYKAAYSDLARAFGSDRSAYINHYLTVGVYEGRTKGVLFDPLLYAEAYGDVKEAFGYNISEIVRHYLAFGISEDRIQGTAHGYADIAAAEKAGVQNTNINRNVDGTGGSQAAVGNQNRNSADSGKTDTGDDNDRSPDSDNTADAGAPDSNIAVDAGISGSGIAGTSSPNSDSTVVNSSSFSVDTADGSSDAGVTAAESSSVSAETEKNYDHTTSVYDDDETTLLRVEYYDESGKLLQYSDVTYSDSGTNSYTENIYHYDEETDTEILDRTDVYENGSLVSSVNQ
ncbi:MAG: hypothetical protein NC341_11230 [Blautia sp.]|nr:hypothetical protein [Blautia sp.]MCM1202127.1 hypothetical protein [Bacteroides fragilis]